MKNSFEHSPVPEKYLKMAELRDKTYREMEQEVEERIKKDPMPTDQEILLGSYLEDLEPSVRQAILEFNRKGYRTQSSGFGGGEYWELQQMDGPFVIDKETEEKLKGLGVSVRTNNEYGITHIEFEPESADLEDIKNKWNEIAERLTDTKKSNVIPGGPWLSERWFDNKDIQRLCAERRLALNAYDTPEEKAALESVMATTE